MPFSDTNSITAANMNNTFRGLHRDFTDNSHTGDTNETDLATVSITGGTMTSTGTLFFFGAGTITTGGGNKSIKVDFGATEIVDTTAKAGTADWFVRGWIMNTATDAQRIHVEWSDNTNATNFNADYTTAAIDTTANVTLRFRGLLSAVGDTITQTLFFVDVQQIT